MTDATSEFLRTSLTQHWHRTAGADCELELHLETRKGQEGLERLCCCATVYEGPRANTVGM